ncbi:MAG: tryptophan--tRNA ligase [Saprospiraceae bacterium]|nr:tryptophan--tRNA ligase [Saprospiraceae bacterium]MCB0623958.1 tryptophan--tRNA ligase [Saprospiraceae bacterium]MCB0678997.1 tryptophan--tRNA ligase [Saprospiraceae bacterium]MCB0683233.1 tryptophan--tRNA ligase [Saprospiraceae bacterium]
MTTASAFDVLSCIKPTGEIHIGNYFGAIRNWVEMQDRFRCLFGVVDLHAMTMPYEPRDLRFQTDELFLDLLACGMDPSRSTLFVQSLVPEHLELTWILGTITPVGELRRQTQFKERYDRQKGEEANAPAVSAGLFTYPVLQAADILIYRARIVPVGEDQAQHLELTRRLAQRFNQRFGEYFPIPEASLTSTPRIRSLAAPEKKMGKSLGEKHYIGLFEEPDRIRQKIRQAVTDSGPNDEHGLSEGVKNLFQILEGCGALEAHRSLQDDLAAGVLLYADLKEAVAEALLELTGVLRQRRQELLSDRGLINDTIREMSLKARLAAKETLYEVREMAGIKSISYF